MDLFERINEYSLVRPEIKYMVYDLFRTITVQFIVQLLFSLNTSVPLMSSTFIQTTLYLCVGVVLFWVIIYKLLVQKISF